MTNSTNRVLVPSSCLLCCHSWRRRMTNGAFYDRPMLDDFPSNKLSIFLPRKTGFGSAYLSKHQNPSFGTILELINYAKLWVVRSRAMPESPKKSLCVRASVRPSVRKIKPSLKMTQASETTTATREKKTPRSLSGCVTILYISIIAKTDFCRLKVSFWSPESTDLWPVSEIGRI